MTQEQDVSARDAVLTFKAVGEALGSVQDPEIHIGITELGLVYGVAIVPAEKGGGVHVRVSMSLTSPMCPYGPMLMAMVHAALAKLPEVRQVNVELTFDPVWDPRTMASDECKDLLGIY